MNVPPSILCPVDFSDASRGALRYAAAVAGHFGTRLIVLTVEDPLLTEAMDLGAGVVWKPEESHAELAQFAAKTFGRETPAAVTLEYEVAVGKPAAEILRVARERSCDLIVMSTHGLTGMRKLFFGSTTERVLRETVRPVLITPAVDPGPIRLSEAGGIIRRVMVPVDLSAASPYQIKVAEGLAAALNVPLIVSHVVEPVRSRLAARLHLPSLEADRRAQAEDGLNELVGRISRKVHSEALVAYGDPAEEIAKVARDRQVGVVVMGLHGSPLLGPRMGSVTYRLLCLVSTMVLAIPPQPVKAPVSAGLQHEPSQTRVPALKGSGLATAPGF
jgi:nucleotide-binding universal stress UspA family protein